MSALFSLAPELSAEPFVWAVVLLSLCVVVGFCMSPAAKAKSEKEKED